MKLLPQPLKLAGVVCALAAGFTVGAGVATAGAGAGVSHAAAGVQRLQAGSSASGAGANIVAGLHDTEINDCDDSGTLRAAGQLAQAQLLEAQAAFSSGHWPGAVTTVRVIVPWDIADAALVFRKSSPQYQKLNAIRQCFDSWLRGAFGKHLTPEVDFGRDTRYVTPAGETQMPTLSQYDQAITDFRTQYVDCNVSHLRACSQGGKGRVTIVAAWNEPDNYDLVFPHSHTHLAGKICPASPTPSNCGAVMAAQLWVAAQNLIKLGNDGGRKCGNCVIVAGDFSAADGLDRVRGGACRGCTYLDLYNRYLENLSSHQQYHPDKWAVHPYTDIKNYEKAYARNPKVANSAVPAKLTAFARNLKRLGYRSSTFIWLNEISTYSNSPWSPTTQAAAMKYLLHGLPGKVGSGGPQVGRIDYYCFANGQECSPSWALVVNGAPTKAYAVFTAWANRHGRADGKASSPAAPAAPAARALPVRRSAAPVARPSAKGALGGFENAFQANTGAMWTSEPAGTGGTWGRLVAPGTSPSIAAVTRGYEVAFQGANHDLWLRGSARNADTGLGMMPGTSPSITPLFSGGYEVAFQANTTHLWVTGTAGTGDQGLGMMPGTSPSITWHGGRGWEAAFQANTGVLWTAGSAGIRNWGLGIAPGTSPSITVLRTDGYEVAFNAAGTHDMWTAGTAGEKNWGAGMDPASSPSITVAAGGYEVALQTNTHDLWTLGTDADKDWHLGMMAGSSPAIGSVSAGRAAFEIAFQANTGRLWNAGADGTGGNVFGMARATSPTITSV